MEKITRQCKICNAQLKGRRDKLFCSTACKNEYHTDLRRKTAKAVREIDKILHRNRSILLEVMGNNTSQKKVDRKILDQKKFNFSYMTGYYLNSRGKTYHLVYDYAWMEFSDGEVLIIKRK
jgi:hypothetical protein